MSGDKDGLLYWPKFFLDHTSTSSSSWPGLLNCGSLRAAKPSVCKLFLTLASCLQLSQTIWATGYIIFYVHLLQLFFRLFTQVHLLINGSVEGQYITLVSMAVYIFPQGISLKGNVTTQLDFKALFRVHRPARQAQYLRNSLSHVW